MGYAIQHFYLCDHLQWFPSKLMRIFSDLYSQNLNKSESFQLSNRIRFHLSKSNTDFVFTYKRILIYDARSFAG